MRSASDGQAKSRPLCKSLLGLAQMKPHHKEMLASYLSTADEKPSIAELQAEAQIRLPKMYHRTVQIAPLVLTVPLFSIARGRDKNPIDITWSRRGRGNLRYIGRPLTQSHQTALFALVKLRAGQVVSNAMKYRPSAILSLMEWSDSGGNIARLRGMLDDLKEGQLRVWAENEDQQRSALRVSFIDSFKPEKREPWYLRLSEDIMPLYQGHLTYIDLPSRARAGQKEGLGTFLYGFLSAESCQLPFSYADLHRASGSRTAQVWKFADECRRVLRHFKEEGLILDFRLVPGGFRVLKK